MEDAVKTASNDQAVGELSPVDSLIKVVQQMSAGMNVVISNQERLLTEQEKMKKALGEAGICIQTLDETLRKHAAGLVNHAEVLETNNKAILRLWQEAGLPLNESPKTPPPSQVN